MNESYSIKDIISLMLSKLWLLILFLILGAAGAFAYSHFVMPVIYESYTSMYVRSSDKGSSSADINQGELTASRSLVSTYIVALKSNYVMEKAAENLEKEYPPEVLAEYFSMTDGKISLKSLRSKVSMSSVENTEILKITASTKNPEISAAVCNSIAEAAPACLIKIVGAGSVEIIDVADPVYIPVSPNKPKIALIGGMAGLCLAALLIFLIDFFDNSVRLSEALTDNYQKAVFGEIMHFGTDNNSKKSGNTDTHQTILDSKTDFNIIENYKSIRSNIMFALSTTDRKVLAISSANPSEGKSLTTANIALAFAQTENKILLIDADMRKPVQHKIFNLSNKKGLSTAIGHMNPLEESIHRNVYQHLDVMPSGPIPPNPSEMLASQQFADMLAELEPQYDYILIDTPPINVVSDTLAMGKAISGLLLVVRYAKTTFEELQDSISHANLSEINLLGFVLNDISRKGSGHYYSYKYKYRYKYKNYEYQYTSHSPEEKLETAPVLSLKQEKSAEQSEAVPAEEVTAEQLETVQAEKVTTEQPETAPAEEVTAESQEKPNSEENE